MYRYIVRRLLQTIPLLLLITMILFILVNSMGDPLNSFAGGRRRLRPEDRARLTQQLGLDQPLPVQYLIWLVGNQWMKVDLDGDGCITIVDLVEATRSRAGGWSRAHPSDSTTRTSPVTTPTSIDRWCPSACRE